MPTERPSRSLSQKLLGLGRLRARSPEDKDQKQQEQQRESRFQMVHTPDRTTPTRPTPTEDECREEFRKWHGTADRDRDWERGGDDTGGTGGGNQDGRDTGGTIKDPDAAKAKGKGKGKGRYDLEPSPVSPSPYPQKEKEEGGGDDNEEENAREDREKRQSHRQRQRRFAVVAAQAQAVAVTAERSRERTMIPREMGGYATPPVFRPPRPLNDVEVLGASNMNREGRRVAVPAQGGGGGGYGRRSSSTLPSQAQDAGNPSKTEPIPIPVLRRRGQSESRSPRSQSVDVDFDNLSLGSSSSSFGTARSGSADHRGRETGIRGATCPGCGNPLSRIERFTCGRCRFDLSRTGNTTARQDRGRVVPGQTSRHVSVSESPKPKPAPGRYHHHHQQQQQHTLPKSPPPLRDRPFLQEGPGQVQVSPARQNPRFVQFPAQPVPRGPGTPPVVHPTPLSLRRARPAGSVEGNGPGHRGRDLGGTRPPVSTSRSRLGKWQNEQRSRPLPPPATTGQARVGVGIGSINRGREDVRGQSRGQAQAQARGGRADSDADLYLDIYGDYV